MLGDLSGVLWACCVPLDFYGGVLYPVGIFGAGSTGFLGFPHPTGRRQICQGAPWASAAKGPAPRGSERQVRPAWPWRRLTQGYESLAQGMTLPALGSEPRILEPAVKQHGMVDLTMYVQLGMGNFK